MDAWTYQGIELKSDEDPASLFQRICRLEDALGLCVSFQAVGVFSAPMSKADPPHFSPKGQLRRFLHVTWGQESAEAWSILLHIAEREHRALLSSFTGAGFLSKDIDFRDGHPRESILLAAFTSNAEDFLSPLVSPTDDDPANRDAAWQSTVERAVQELTGDGAAPEILRRAAGMAKSHRVRFEHGWYLNSGVWRSRYLVQCEDGFMAIAAAQDSLCTCASRYPETLQLMMASNGCIHHIAARLVDGIAGSTLEPD